MKSDAAAVDVVDVVDAVEHVGVYDDVADDVDVAHLVKYDVSVADANSAADAAFAGNVFVVVVNVVVIIILVIGSAAVANANVTMLLLQITL